jgi:hypothetical protein
MIFEQTDALRGYGLMADFLGVPRGAGPASWSGSVLAKGQYVAGTGSHGWLGRLTVPMVSCRLKRSLGILIGAFCHGSE